MFICPDCGEVRLIGNKNQPCKFCELIEKCPPTKNVCKYCGVIFENEDIGILSACDDCIQDIQDEQIERTA